jgi:hypothetical protein
MKVLLDENLPHALRGLLLGHDAYTVAYLGWSATKNGALLQRAAADGFDVFLTLDNGVRYQQNQQTLPLAIVVVRAPSNDIDDLHPLMPDILAALAAVTPRTLVVVPETP